MKYKLNLGRTELRPFAYFAIGLLIILEVIFYKSGFLNILIISLKLSVLIHLSGYLLALKLFKEEFDLTALLFFGLAFGLITNALFYYLPSLFGINVNHIIYVVPIVLLVFGILIHLSKKEKQTEIKAEKYIEKQEPTQNP